MSSVTPQLRRSLRLGLLALALLILLIGAWVAHSGLLQLNQVRREANQVRQRLGATESEMIAAKRHAQRVELARRLVDQAHAQGFEPARWVERKVNLRSAGMGRRDANGLLNETRVDARTLFLPDNFDVAVLDARGSLFDPPGKDDRGLSVTLRGVFYAREQE
jgi:hypothetical protein